MEVTFKFAPNTAIYTPFNDPGIISMCAVDDNGEKCYHVKTATHGDWFKEHQLTIRD